MLTKEALETTFYWLKKKAAVGGGVSWDNYARNVSPNIADLHIMLHYGSYKARLYRQHYTSRKQMVNSEHLLDDKKSCSWHLLKS
jgi:hypothetical protein